MSRFLSVSYQKKNQCVGLMISSCLSDLTLEFCTFDRWNSDCTRTNKCRRRCSLQDLLHHQQTQHALLAGCLGFTSLIFQTVTSSQCERLPGADLIFICCTEGHKNRQLRAVIGGPVLRDRRRAEEQLNHLDIHQEVAAQKATAAVGSPID